MNTQDYSNSMGLLFDSSVQVSQSGSDRQKIPYVSVLSDRIVLYSQPECTGHRRCMNLTSLSNLRKNKPSGIMPITTRARIRKIIDTWLSCILYYNQCNRDGYALRDHFPIFITLTLCSKQKHTDEYIKRTMLTQFIQKVQANHDIKNLFWRAERQKNGNIHFHIITDRFIPKEKITKYWTELLDKEGYLIEYQKKFNKKIPPSTNVESADSIKDFIEYVMKYSTKDSVGEVISGRIYGMTDNLRRIKPFITEQDSTISSDIDTIIATNRPKKFEMEFAAVFLFIGKKALDFKTTTLISWYRTYLLETYDKIYFDWSDNGQKELESGGVVLDEKREDLAEQLSIFDICPSYCPIVQQRIEDSEWW